MAKVSVIVPAFNAEEYLGRAVDSLLAQTLPEIEVVIVDDGSTDQTRVIADAYAADHPDRVVVVGKPNGGLSDARNVGVAHSKGEYVGFVDADDFVEPAMFGHLHDLAVRNDCEIAVCRYVHEDPSGENATVGGVLPFGEGEVFGPEGFFLSSHVMMVCNKIYRRELVEKFPQPHTWFEDIAWTPVVMSRVERICSTPRAYYHYIRRPGSIAYSHRDPRTLQGIQSLRYAIDHADHRYRDEVLHMAARRLRFEAKRRRLYADRYMATLHEWRQEIGNSPAVLNDSRLLVAIARYLRDDFRPIPQVVVTAQVGRERTARELENSRTWVDPMCAPDARIMTLSADDIPDTGVARELRAARRLPVLEDYLRLRYVHEHGGIALEDSIVARKPIGWALHRSECFFAFADDRRVSKAMFGATAGHPRIERLLEDFEQSIDTADPLQAALDALSGRVEVQPGYDEVEARFRARYLKVDEETRIYASGVFCNDFGADLATTYVYPNTVTAPDAVGASAYFRRTQPLVLADYLAWKQERRESAAEPPKPAVRSGPRATVAAAFSRLGRFLRLPGRKPPSLRA